MNEILEQLKRYFDNTPRDIIEKEWNLIGESCRDVGPKIDEFLVLLDKNNEFENFKITNLEKYPSSIQSTPNYYSEFFIFANSYDIVKFNTLNLSWIKLPFL